MDCRENKLPFGFGEEEQYTSPYFSYPPSFRKLCPMEFNGELKNARLEAGPGNSNSQTPSDDSYSDTDSCSGDDALDEGHASLDGLLLDGKANKKIEQLAAMVGVNTTEPALVLAEVVRVLKLLKMRLRILNFQSY